MFGKLYRSTGQVFSSFMFLFSFSFSFSFNLPICKLWEFLYDTDLTRVMFTYFISKLLINTEQISNIFTKYSFLNSERLIISCCNLLRGSYLYSFIHNDLTYFLHSFWKLIEFDSVLPEVLIFESTKKWECCLSTETKYLAFDPFEISSSII